MNRLRYAAAALLCVLASPLFASNTTVTAVVTDTDGQAWNDGTWKAVLTLPSGPFGNVTPTVGGSPVPTTRTGVLDGSGTLGASLTNTSSLDQTGGQWQITVCPNASVPQGISTGCFTVTRAITGGSFDLTSAFTGIPAPRIPAGDQAFAYSDIEILPVATPGTTYYNTGTVTATKGLRIWDGKSWQGVGGGGGGGGGNVLDAQQKRIYIQPQAGVQAIAGPSGQTQDAVTPILQGAVNSDQFATGSGSNGLANLTSGFCATGHCNILFPANSASTEIPNWYTGFLSEIPAADGTQVQDFRYGSQINSYINPAVPSQAWSVLPQAARLDIVNYTKPYAYQYPGFVGTYTKVEAGFGGNNYFTSNGPFKTTYEGHSTTMEFLTPGQHIASDLYIDCFGMGDCIGTQHHFRIVGGMGDNSDEGAHKGADYILADTSVGVTNCASGCTAGSTNISLTAPVNAAQNMWIEDWTAGKYHPSTDYGAGCRIDFGQSQGQPLAFVATTGCTFPDSYLTLSSGTYDSSGLQVAVGNVNIPIQTGTLPPGYSPSTSGYPGTPFTCGIADHASAPGDTTNPDYYEQTQCTVVNATTINATLRKPHPHVVLIAYGGMAGNDFNSAASSQDGNYLNIANGSLSQSMHIVYSYGNTLWLGDYAHNVNVADTNGFSDESQVKYMTMTVNAVRTGGNVTMTFPSVSTVWASLRPSFTGCSDATMNFPSNTVYITQVTPTTYTYAQAGANSTCTGGTLLYDAARFVINPSAQIYDILNATTRVYDGGNMTLFPNNLPLASNDKLVFVHDAHQSIRGNGGFGIVGYVLPKPNNSSLQDGGGDGCVGGQLVGPSYTCFTAIIAAGPSYVYTGNGGVRGHPDAFYGGYISPNSLIDPKWDMHMQAGQYGIFNIDANYWERTNGVCDFRAVETIFNFNGHATAVWDPCANQWIWGDNMSIGGGLSVQTPIWDGVGVYEFGGTLGSPDAMISRAGNGFFFQKDKGSGLVGADLYANDVYLAGSTYIGFGDTPTTYNPITFLSNTGTGTLSIDSGSAGLGNHKGFLQLSGFGLYSPTANAFASIIPNTVMPAGNLTFTLPGIYPTSTQVLTVDTAGNLGYGAATVSGFTGTVNTSATCTLNFTGGVMTGATGPCP